MSNPSQSNGLMIGGLGNGGAGSMRRSGVANGKSGAHMGNVNSKTGNHKRSLDSQNIGHGHHMRNHQNRHSTNGNFYSNYHQPQKQHINMNPNIKSGK
jgi:hypothetical protein